MYHEIRNVDRDEYSLKLRNLIGDLVGHALTTEDEYGNPVKRATKYLTPKMVVRAVYVGKPGKVRARHQVNVSIGSPNYRERQFIKECKKAGEPFPVKAIQLNYASNRAGR